MKTQLLLAYCFPPQANAESIVTAQMVKALSSLGWQSQVCTERVERGNGQADADLEDLLPDGLTVYRCAPLPGSRCLRLLRRMGLRKLSATLAALPDESLFWIPVAVRLLRRLQHHGRWDVIHSRAMPFGGNLLGLLAKRMLGIPWLAHFSDPWVDSPFYLPATPRLRRLHLRWEREIISVADRVTFTNERALRVVMAKYPSDWAAKCRVVPHGFSRHAPGGPVSEPLEAGCLNVVYLGSLYGIRNPDVLFRALHALRADPEIGSRVRIWLVGRMPMEVYARNVRDLSIGGMVRLMPPVSYTKALQTARRADVLLTIDPVGPGPDVFSPSKLIEYLGLGKPIWGIVRRTGANARLIEAAGGVTADHADAPAVAASLRRLLDRWRRGELRPPDPNYPDVQCCSIDRTAEGLAAILDDMRSAARPH